MLRSLELTYQLGIKDIPLRTRRILGSIFHSLFMSDLAEHSPAFFEQLHTSGNQLRPFKLSWPTVSQEGLVQWKIYSLNEPMASYLESWAANPTPEWHINQLKTTLSYVGHNLSEAISYSKFTAKYYSGSSTIRDIRLVFQSPTTFKWAGNKHYYPLPDPRLILQSGLNKWNTFADRVSLQDPDLLETLVSHIQFSDLQIKSRLVGVDRGIIPAFTGHVQFRLQGPTALKELIILILNYETYCGIGAKAQMGLGDLLLDYTDSTTNSPIIKENNSCQNSVISL